MVVSGGLPKIPPPNSLPSPVPSVYTRRERRPLPCSRDWNRRSGAVHEGAPPYIRSAVGQEARLPRTHDDEAAQICVLMARSSHGDPRCLQTIHHKNGVGRMSILVSRSSWLYGDGDSGMCISQRTVAPLLLVHTIRAVYVHLSFLALHADLSYAYSHLLRRWWAAGRPVDRALAFIQGPPRCHTHSRLRIQAVQPVPADARPVPRGARPPAASPAQAPYLLAITLNIHVFRVCVLCLVSPRVAPPPRLALRVLLANAAALLSADAPPAPRVRENACAPSPQSHNSFAADLQRRPPPPPRRAPTSVPASPFQSNAPPFNSNSHSSFLPTRYPASADARTPSFAAADARTPSFAAAAYAPPVHPHRRTTSYSHCHSFRTAFDAVYGWGAGAGVHDRAVSDSPSLHSHSHSPSRARDHEREHGRSEREKPALRLPLALPRARGSCGIRVVGLGGGSERMTSTAPTRPARNRQVSSRIANDDNSVGLSAVAQNLLSAKPIIDLVKKIAKLTLFLPETVPLATEEDDIPRRIFELEGEDGTVASTFNRRVDILFGEHLESIHWESAKIPLDLAQGKLARIADELDYLCGGDQEPRKPAGKIADPRPSFTKDARYEKKMDVFFAASTTTTPEEIQVEVHERN
ncbi:hypothetical protein B0H10DRAFT_2226775 [Mycena sp. CBHHK59/15]|nr:hypothetical protein B0H10DRAFT_2226775 [Mycena sp. CBHHK59/15]